MAVKRIVKEQLRSQRKKKTFGEIDATLRNIGANKNKINNIKGE